MHEQWEWAEYIQQRLPNVLSLGSLPGGETHTNPEDEEDCVWYLPGQDFYRLSQTLPPPIVEVAGPTLGGYPPLIGEAFPQQVLVSNRTPKRETQTLDIQYIGELAMMVGPPYSWGFAFQADVQNLPFADGSIGTLLCSQLAVMDVEDEEIRTKDFSALRLLFLQEATRVLCNSGLCIVRYIQAHEFLFARELNLFPVALWANGFPKDLIKHFDLAVLQKNDRP